MYDTRQCNGPYKQLHWLDLENEMVERRENDQQYFLRVIGKMSVIQSKHIQMKELEQDGNANYDISIVLGNVFVYILRFCVLYFRYM